MARMKGWLGKVALGLIVVLGLLIGSVYLLSEARLSRTHEVPATSLVLSPDAIEKASVERGAHVYVTRGCAGCHGDDLAGKTVIDDPMMGQVAGSNLTHGMGGLDEDCSTEDYMRSVRHGVAPDGRPRFLMPSAEYRNMDDQDLADLIAFMESAEPVESAAGAIELGPMSRILILNGEMELAAEHLDHGATVEDAPPAGVTAEYGAYLAATCSGCHGHELRGGKIAGAPPDWPAATDLSRNAEGGLAAWDEADFIKAIREATRPDGSAIDPIMPADQFARMTDTELKAIWAFLGTLPGG